MENKYSFSEGVEYFNKHISNYASLQTTDASSTSYLSDIEEKIIKLKNDVNGRQGNGCPQLHGYILEDWHRGTFNIDAAVKRTGDSAITPPAQDFASVDIQVIGGDAYQAKAYRDAKSGAFALCKTYKQEYNQYLNELHKQGKPDISEREFLIDRGVDPDTDMNLPIYHKMVGLMPSDQIPDAISELKFKIALETSKGRLSEVQRYEIMLKKLTDNVAGPNGAESIPLSKDELEVLTNLAKNGKFDPADYDITIAQKADYLYLCGNLIESGLSASIIAATIKTAPDIAKIFVSLLRDGMISHDDLDKLGADAKSGAKDGFVRGIMVAAIKNACSLGHLGESLQKASMDASNAAFNSIVAVLSIVVTETISDSIKKASGRMTEEEYCYRLSKRVYVSGMSVAGGLTLQGIMAFAPVLGYTIGSFIGSILGGVLFEVKEQFLLSLCINKGWTFFGIVKQDYTLPDSVIKKLGMELYELDNYKEEEFTTDEFSTEEYQISEFVTEDISICGMRRGIIGVRKIGYVI